ncbi:MAG: hypothetical protein Q9209_006737 [Squamulea sp. 1 TL-2023]
MTVPLILEDICHAPNESGIKALQPLDFVACGGGPMKTTVAEMLSSKGVRLLNHCGATEIGALAPIFNPPPEYDWHYFVIRQDLDLRLEDVPQKPGCVKLVGRAPGWDEDFVVQDFLQPNPKAPKTQFHFLGRADDLIVLANGEKIRCTSLEAMVASDPKVTGAIAFGEGRNHLGLIIEAAPDVGLDISDAEGVSSFREAIWPLVEKANETIDSHGSVSRNMIIVATSPSRPLNRTDKGSLARQEIYHSFREEIDATYFKAEIANAEPLPSLHDTIELENYVRRAITDNLNLTHEVAPIGVDEDIFELGMNSLQATKLHNMFKSALQKAYDVERIEPFLSKGFIYSHPSISSLCRALASIADSNSSTFNGHIAPSRSEAMTKAVDRHCKAITAMSSAEPWKPGGRIVVVTGSTGHLGSSLVYNLAQDPNVALIYGLNRPSSSSSDEADRQHRAFSQVGISLPLHLWSKLKLIEVKPQQIDFGLSPDVYAQLTKASYIVHNAWPMDFNRSLVSFEVQFEYLRNIILLALQNTSNEPTRVLFTSSIASVARYPLKLREPLVPETPMDDPDVTAPFGYPEAKWVCEQMLLQSARMHPTRFEPIIVRVGQLTGSTTAASWSPAEHLPSIFKSSQSLGALPDIPGVRNSSPSPHPLPFLLLIFPNSFITLLPREFSDIPLLTRSTKTLSWIPLDIAAASVLEILFQPDRPATSPVYHIENPTRQSWPDMLAALSRSLCQSPSPSPLPDSPSSPALSTSSSSSESTHTTTTTATTDTSRASLPLIPFDAWMQKVREEPDLDRNPARRLVDFLEESFTQLGTGALVLDTKEAKKVSRSLRELGPVVDEELLGRYVDFWRAEGAMF